MANKNFISNLYEEARTLHKRELDAKKDELYTKYPRLDEIAMELMKLGISVSKLVLDPSQDTALLLEELEAKQYKLKKERLNILVEHGYAKNFLDMTYSCEKCKDTGFIGQDKCICYKQKAITQAYDQSNLSKSLVSETFDHFNISYYSEAKNQDGNSPRSIIKDIYSKCLDYVHDFDNTSENLLFIGSPGVGKTFMSHCMAKELLDNGKTVIYLLCGDLIDIIRNSKFDFEKGEEHDNIMQDIYECDFLIIDDFGTELQSSFSQQVVFDILNKRLMLDKKMLVITNLDIKDIYAYSERIHSRLLGEFTMYEFIGEDIRIKKKLN